VPTEAARSIAARLRRRQRVSALAIRHEHRVVALRGRSALRSPAHSDGGLDNTRAGEKLSGCRRRDRLGLVHEKRHSLAHFRLGKEDAMSQPSVVLGPNTTGYVCCCGQEIAMVLPAPLGASMQTGRCSNCQSVHEISCTNINTSPASYAVAPVHHKCP
jgi:hypothetical protein